MTSPRRTSPQDLLAAYPPPVRARAEALRALVKQTAPGADETVFIGWQALSYAFGREFCSIMPFVDHVNVVFHEGADLADPEGLLEGEGREPRRVRLDAGAEIPVASLAALIKAAAGRAR